MRPKGDTRSRSEVICSIGTAPLATSALAAQRAWSTRIATVVCGGEIDRGALVDEEWLLKLERKHFVELAQQEKTQARIGHMLKTGKPLRN